MKQLSASGLASAGRHVGLRVALPVAAVLPNPIRAALLVMTGRNDGCGLKQIIRAMERTRVQAQIMERLGRESRLVERDDSGMELWDTEHGLFYIVPTTNMGAVFHMLSEQKTDVYGGPDCGVRAGDTVLDCGANYGAFTRTALNRGASRVIAFEPAPRTFACLERTFSKEIAEGRVIAVHTH